MNDQSNRLVSDKVWEEVFEPDRNEPETVQPRITRIQMIPDGPLLVIGAISVITDDQGQSWNPEKPLALCRCGCSNDKPFCDGNHIGCEVGSPGGEIE